MIRPAKHLNLDSCVLRAAAVLLVRLREERICRFSDLRQSLEPLGDDADPVFMPTVHFLFLMGRINYHPQTDSFEYLEPQGEEARNR
ncbi:MAG: hypothetical protein GVY36_16650 [Verrucomicrobia bacterium]|jgi:hypothetical protein|nr:hypothetical protein [Verrucomicrobiota bacterium]